MIGRGLISDPFLPSMIKNDETEYPEDRVLRFKRFHESLLNEYVTKLSGDKAVIQKMLSFWKYFSTTFTDPVRIVKRIKKTKTLDAYDNAVAENLEDMENTTALSQIRN
jgi:tRNA-dihydrouridine synthase